MASFLKNVEDKIEEVFGLITSANGYSKDWGSVNERDPNFQTYPSVFTKFAREFGNDDEDMSNAQSYTNGIELFLLVRDELNTSEEDPRLEIRDFYYEDMDLIKKAFGLDSALEDAGIMSIKYMGTEWEDVANADQFVPSKMIMQFNLIYSQDRLDPTIVAC